MDLLVLGAELGEKTLWNPTILGWLVAICAVGLFCGSVWLLLATNMGALRGFLVAFTGLCGLMVLMTLLWQSSAFPLNSLRGRQAAWDFVEIVPSVEESSVGAVRTIKEEGEQVAESEVADVQAAANSVLIRAAEEDAAAEQENARFDPAGPTYIVQNVFEVGGERRLLVFHEPRYAALEFCTELDQPDPFPAPPPDPVCDASKPNEVIVFERDLGSLRQPPFVAMVAFGLLFGLGLVALHWYERNEPDDAEAATTGRTLAKRGS